MATAREYLQSIIATCAVLQERTDEELERASSELQAIDEAFDDVTYAIDPEG